MQLIPVTRDRVPYYWKEAWALLEPAAKRNGLYTETSVVKALGKGELQLWIAGSIAALTEIAQYPGIKQASVVLMGGKGWDESLPCLDVLEAWAKANGCKRFVNAGRPGLSKKLKGRGYRMASIVMVKDL